MALTTVCFPLYMATQKTNKPLLLSAILESKDEMVMMRPFLVTDFFLDIEIEGVVEDVHRSYYSVQLYVEDIKVAELKKSKPLSSEVKLEWKESNQM